MTFNENNWPATRVYPYPSPLLSDLHLTPGFEQPAADWISPPATWTPNDSPFTDLESLPSSATGSAAICQDPSCDPFEQSFASIQNSIDSGTFAAQDSFLGAAPATYQNGYSVTSTNDNSYVNLSSIDEAAHFNYNGNEDPTPRPEMTTSQTPLTSPFPSPGLVMASQPQVVPQSEMQLRPRRPAWGHPRSRGSSISTSTSFGNRNQKRRKSMDQPTARLRSTSSSTYRPDTSSSAGTGRFSTVESGRGEGTKTRSNHNQVEKQYRNRLNSQFELLLSILPREDGAPLPFPPGYPGGDGYEHINSDAGRGGDGDAARRVSKAEVLILAKKHIRRLERESRGLEEENLGLRARVEDLKRVWVEGGGVCMP